MAGDVRRGQRLLLRPRKLQPPPAARRSHPAGDQARRRDRLGVHVPLRRRRPAVDQRAVAGHGAPAAREGLLALQRSGLPVHRPAALGIFKTPPPQGVRVDAANGAALYAQYSFAPSDRILNGFIQSLVGLYDYTSITKDPLGLVLFQAGDAEARIAGPPLRHRGMELYDQFGESDLNYHELLTEFLQHLCERTQQGAAARAAGAVTADGIYCTTAQHFTADLRPRRCCRCCPRPCRRPPAPGSRSRCRRSRTSS